MKYKAILFFLLIYNFVDAQFIRREMINDSVDSIQIKVISHTDLTKVKKYEKFELAINLNDSIENLIKLYTNNMDSPSIINPFNPDKISIEADFILKTDSLNFTYKKYGFYYEEFFRLNERYIKKPLQELFRLRFTAQQTGDWQAVIKVFINKELYTYSDTLSFKVINSDLNDFISVGENPYYLEQNNKTFIPIGINLSNPLSNSLDAWRGTKSPPLAYTKYHSELDEFKENGGNYFRLLQMPWNLELEFEEIGNYTSRMSSAWEMDRILEKTKSLDLFIHLSLQSFYALQDAGSYSLFYWDWPDNNSPKYDSICSKEGDNGYCYFKNLGIENPVDFLRHRTAIKYYKNKIRYYISRYGYSTNIALIELICEANNIGNNYTINNINGKGCDSEFQKNSYSEDSIVPILVYNWQKEISNYIKEELNHSEHLLAVNYAGQPDINRGDSSYFAKNIDVITYNKYGIDISKSKYINSIKSYKEIKKPFIFSEIGVTDKTVMNSGEYIYFVRELYLSLFTGSAGTGISWYGRYNPDGVWENFNNLAQFVDSLDLSDTNWTAYSIDRRDYKADLVCLKNSEIGQSIGIISNLTFNYYTQAKDTVGLRKESINENQMNLEDISSGNFGNALKINDLNTRKNYKIEWWDLINNEKIGETIQKSGFFGNLKLKHPDLLVENGEKRHLIGFKVTPKKP